MGQHQLNFSVQGMHCGACVGRVEKALNALPDVLSAHANLAQETVTVSTTQGQHQTIIEAAKQAGYPLALLRSQQDQDRAKARKDGEHAHLRRMFLIAAALTIPVFVLEMGGHLIPAFHHWVMRTIGQQPSWTFQFVLTTLVLLWPGRTFFTIGIPALLRGAPDMNALVVIGASAAWGFSVVSLFAPSLLPTGSAAVYFEAAAVIVTLILLGRVLEARAKGRTGAAITKLINLAPRNARVEKNGAVVEVAVDQITLGDTLHLRPGERVAVDGVVLTGTSHLDEAMLTGEAMPVEKTPDAALTAGTLNGTGSLTYRATAVGGDTVLAQIIQMVETAQGARLPIQDLVTRITLWFVPAVLAIAALTFGAWMLWGPTPALGHALVAAVAVLIIACPCAMGLATPTSIMVGTGRAAELGVLFRQGDALQGLESVDWVAFDKTGTLSAGRPALRDIHVFGDWQADEVLRLVASAEARSEHPIAQTIVQEAEQRNLPLTPPDQFNATSGAGVKAHVEGRALVIGTARFMAEEGLETPAFPTQLSSSDTPVYIAIDGSSAAILTVGDALKPSTPAALRALKDQGLKLAMITGDTQSVADAMARDLPFDRVFAQTLPGDKAKALSTLDGKVAFVGDGINDAPALAHADVGIAIGTGTDVAIEAADVVLISGDLGGVARALRVSRATLSNIRQNLFWAFGYNVLLIPVAAGVLYPAFGVLLSPMLAAGAMALSSVFVLTNALRLRFVP